MNTGKRQVPKRDRSGGCRDRGCYSATLGRYCVAHSPKITGNPHAPGGTLSAAPHPTVPKPLRMGAKAGTCPTCAKPVWNDRGIWKHDAGGQA